MPPEYEQLTHIIVAMRNLIERETRELATANPQWDRRRDARLMVFSNILAVIDSVMVGLVFTKGVLPGDRFWSEYGLQFHADPPAAAKAAQHDVERRLEGFIKVGFVQVLFSVVENAMRSYLRALDPLACAAGTANFQSVYTTLLKRLSMPIPDATELLDLWREVRNVVHNNGVYFNTKGDTEKTIVYKGRTSSRTRVKSLRLSLSGRGMSKARASSLTAASCKPALRVRLPDLWSLSDG